MARTNRSRSVARVGEEDWVSREEAATVLGVGVLRVDWLVGNGHLEPAVTEGHLVGPDLAGPVDGVSRSSLDAEALWRSKVSRWRRWRRAVRDLLESSGL